MGGGKCIWAMPNRNRALLLVFFGCLPLFYHLISFKYSTRKFGASSNIVNFYRLWYDSLPQKFTLLILRNFIPAKMEFANFEIASKLALLAFKDLAALPPTKITAALLLLPTYIKLQFAQLQDTID